MQQNLLNLHDIYSALAVNLCSFSVKLLPFYFFLREHLYG